MPKAKSKESPVEEVVQDETATDESPVEEVVLNDDGNVVGEPVSFEDIMASQRKANKAKAQKAAADLAGK